MELNTYQKQAMSTCTDRCKNFSYMVLNLVGEVGELASKVAKQIRKGDAYIGFNGDCDLYFEGTDDLQEVKQHMKLEAGDILWQLSGLCSIMGWSLEDIAQMNLDKLASRKERNKIIGEGDDR